MPPTRTSGVVYIQTTADHRYKVMEKPAKMTLNHPTAVDYIQRKVYTVRRSSTKPMNEFTDQSDRKLPNNTVGTCI